VNYFKISFLLLLSSINFAMEQQPTTTTALTKLVCQSMGSSEQPYKDPDFLRPGKRYFITLMGNSISDVQIFKKYPEIRWNPLGTFHFCFLEIPENFSDERRNELLKDFEKGNLKVDWHERKGFKP
jgi:hypothetical protein